MFDNLDLFAIVELPAHELRQLPGNVVTLAGTCPVPPKRDRQGQGAQYERNFLPGKPRPLGGELYSFLRIGWTFPRARIYKADEMASYKSFKELTDREVEGQDYRIRVDLRDPGILIMAPHGGKIEPITSEISEAIAGMDYSFYCLEGLKANGNGVLHIESHLFDEPRALQAVDKADVVITVHGQLDQKQEFVMTGGLHTHLCLEIERQLESDGFQTRPPREGLMGTDPRNICNRGKSRQGVQLEVSRKVRDSLKNDRDRLRVFAEAVRRAIRMKGR